jgi:hypothetical protein
MPCPVACDIDQIIECDRKMIRTYICFYGIIAVFAVALALYLLVHPISDTLAGKLIEPAVTSIAIPFVVLHLKRKNALTTLLVWQSRAQKHQPGEADCDELKTWVDEELKRRLGASSAA